MDDLEKTIEDNNFLDKDHIVFFADDSGEIQFKFSLISIENFQDLILSILSGAINKEIMEFLIAKLNKQGLKEEAINMVMVNKLLNLDESKTPIVKPSNFK